MSEDCDLQQPRAGQEIPLPSREAVFRDLAKAARAKPAKAARRRKASALLRDGNLDLTAIARRTGYGSTAALSKAFAREHAMAPGAYRPQSLRRQTPVQEGIR